MVAGCGYRETHQDGACPGIGIPTNFRGIRYRDTQEPRYRGTHSKAGHRGIATPTKDHCRKNVP